MLLEVLSDVFHDHILAELVIGAEVAQVDQFRQGRIRLVLPHLVDLALQLHLVAIVVGQIGVVLRISVRFIVRCVTQIRLDETLAYSAIRGLPF